MESNVPKVRLIRPPETAHIGSRLGREISGCQNYLGGAFNVQFMTARYFFVHPHAAAGAGAKAVGSLPRRDLTRCTNNEAVVSVLSLIHI